MRHRFWLLQVGVLLGVAGLLAAAPADSKSGKSVTQLPDPPGTGPIMNQLRALFKQWDLDDDGYLDKKELAKAFGYAHPYDYKRPSKSSGADTKAAPDKDDDTAKPADQAREKRRLAKRLDYQFLTQLDQDNDDMISYEEYIRWARDYAVQLKQQAAVQKKIAKAEAKLLQQQSGSARRRAQRELNRERKALSKLTTQMRGFEKQVQQAMKRAGQ